MNRNGAVQQNEVRAKLFGRVELENQFGRSTETMTRDPAPWLMMKYLLLSPKKAASLDELYQTVWEKDGFALKEKTLNVRLFRARDILAPLKLNGAKGLLLRDGEDFQINPEYTIRSDVELFLELMEQRKRIPRDDPAGLDVCIRGLRLFDAPLIQFTGTSPWLSNTRGVLCEEYQALAWDTLDRGEQLRDDRALSLLAERAPGIIPESRTFHSEFGRYLAEKGRQVELLNYQSQLAWPGGVMAGELRPAAGGRPGRREASAMAESARRRLAPVRLGDSGGRNVRLSQRFL